ncbi:hypothetical protein F511_30469 [Dorcoceras hygrometricum]|uniref:Uncharacterized protein n=1 Tax=Dorcoceras hygrometricum TaxID=472368 RepID=A0A2Z7A6I0_9LAMI|nr:hypothetical protein F511_30469 [Dorcoceras hygrometricum]
MRPPTTTKPDHLDLEKLVSLVDKQANLEITKADDVAFAYTHIQLLSFVLLAMPCIRSERTRMLGLRTSGLLPYTLKLEARGFHKQRPVTNSSLLPLKLPRKLPFKIPRSLNLPKISNILAQTNERNLTQRVETHDATYCSTQQLRVLVPAQHSLQDW